MISRPAITEKLDRMLPPGSRRDDTRLAEDLQLHPGSFPFLARDIERAWDIALSPRAIEDWKTLGDVTATIDNSLSVVVA